MALIPIEIKTRRPLTNVQKQANFQARKKQRPEPYPREPKVSGEEAKKESQRHAENLSFAQEKDATGKCFQDECRSCVDLLAIYEGADISVKDVEDEETGIIKKISKKTKLERPNPSRQKLIIRAITRRMKFEDSGLEVDIPIDPDQFEYKSFFEINGIISFRDWLDLRSKARRDLFWLGRMMGKDLYHSIHQTVCDQFVQKDFRNMYYVGYTLNDFHNMIRMQKRFANDGTPCREMMLLDPRGFYKSTIDGLDAVQWLINAPDIRVFLLTGENSLAVSFLQEIKAYFGILEGREPSAFNILFPEYTITGVAVSSTKPLKCPAKILKQKDASLWVNSIVANLSGWHCDVKKGDDVVTDENSNTKEARAKLKKKYDGTKNNCLSWSFIDHIGTRYFTDDWYGSRMLPDKKTGKVPSIKYHCRGAWIVKPEYANRKQFPLKTLTSEMVELTAPQIADWNFLQSLLADGERGFCNQQLNEPSDEAEDSPWINHFTEELLRKHSYPREAAPKEGRIVQTWDLSYGDKTTSDYSVGVTGIIYKNKDDKYAISILDVNYGKWKSSELSTQICLTYRKHSMAEQVCIEKANGAEWLYENLRYVSAKYSVPDIIGKIKLWPIDLSNGAKRNRIRSLEFLMMDDRFHIVNGPYIDEVYKQFCQFTGEKSTSYRKEDIPDAISFLLNYLPKTALMQEADPKEVEKEMEQEAIKANSKAIYNRMFGGPSPSAPKPAMPVPEESRTDPRYAMLARILPSGMRI